MNNQILVVNNLNNRLNQYKDHIISIVQQNPTIGVYNTKKDYAILNSNIQIDNPTIDTILNSAMFDFTDIMFDFKTIN